MIELKEILTKIDLAELAPELQPVTKGRYHLCICPSCGQREAYVYVGGPIICNRLNHCQYKASYWDYIQQRDNLSNQDTFRKLAEYAGLAVAEISPQDAQKAAKRQQEKKSRRELLEKAFAVMQALLFEPEGAATLEYLTKRGYSLEEIRAAGFGHYPEQSKLKKYLDTDLSQIDGQNEDYFSIFSPASFGHTHTLAIPFLNQWKEPEGLIVRSILSDQELLGQSAKYLLNANFKRGDGLFNFDGYSRSNRLVIVEGYIDAAILAAKGFLDVAAIGGTKLTKEQIKQAITHGKKRFILALDSDHAGYTGTIENIGQIEDAGAQVYVVTLPAGYKDPDELIRGHENGLEILKNALENPQKPAIWSANSLISKHCLQDKQELSSLKRDEILDEAFKTAANFKDYLAPYEYFKIIGPALELPEESLKLEAERYKQREKERAKLTEIKQLVGRLSYDIQEGKEPDLSKTRQQLEDITARYSGREIKPYLLADLQADLRNTPDGLNTGFYELDKFITIPQGAISLIAARPSHGKTTFLTNLCLNMINEYPEGTFYFFSYEESKTALALNVINIMAGKELHKEKNKQALKRYVSQGYDLSGYKIPEIEQALERYNEYTQSGRLAIFDEALDAEQLADLITAQKRENPNLTAVFIDYVQKIKYRGAQAQSRQVELQRISGRLLEAAKSANIPVILAAQFNRDGTSPEPRLDHLRESGDLEQDANIVLSLYNETVAKAAKERKEEEGQPQEAANSQLHRIKITALKNRNGIVGRHVYLDFKPQLLKISNMERKNHL